jgi:hypothetical protein
VTPEHRRVAAFLLRDEEVSPPAEEAGAPLPGAEAVPAQRAWQPAQGVWAWVHNRHNSRDFVAFAALVKLSLILLTLTAFAPEFQKSGWNLRPAGAPAASLVGRAVPARRLVPGGDGAGLPAKGGDQAVKISKASAWVAGVVIGVSAVAQADGPLVCWGQSDQCNPPSSLGGVTQVAGGSFHNLALKSDQTVAGWGWNDRGQLSIPAGLSNVTQVAAGSWFSLALRADSTVVAWGFNGNGECNVPSGLMGVTQVQGGAGHVLALKADGSIAAWGANGRGEATVPAGLSGVRQISTHISWHSAALKQDGSVVCWGYNANGQCDVPAGLGPVSQIAVGEEHTMALLESGQVRVWGKNRWGQCNVPTNLSAVKSIAAGGFHSVALTQSGQVVCWGAGSAGGSGNDDCGQSIVPAGLAGVAQIAAGYHHTLALKGPPIGILGVQPISGPSAGGTLVSISGSNFPSNPIVRIAGEPATEVEVVSSSMIRAKTPAAFPGPAVVEVDYLSATAFYYRPDCGSDLDQNGDVDGGDLAILLLDWGQCYNSSRLVPDGAPDFVSIEEPAMVRNPLRRSR